MQRSGEEILEMLKELAPILKDITGQDMGVSVVRNHTVLTYVPAKTLDLKTKAGDSLKVNNGPVARCLKSGEQVVQVFRKDESPFGVPFVNLPQVTVDPIPTPTSLPCAARASPSQWRLAMEGQHDARRVVTIHRWTWCRYPKPWRLLHRSAKRLILH